MNKHLMAFALSATVGAVGLARATVACDEFSRLSLTRLSVTENGAPLTLPRDDLFFQFTALSNADDTAAQVNAFDPTSRTVRVIKAPEDAMKSLLSIGGGLTFGALLSSALLHVGCSCPVGHDMVFVKDGIYVVDGDTAEADYRLEIAGNRGEVTERFTRAGKSYVVSYRTNEYRGDGGTF